MCRYLLCIGLGWRLFSVVDPWILDLAGLHLLRVDNKNTVKEVKDR